MYQKPMNSSVPIFKRMQEHKTIGNARRMNDRGYISHFHPLMGVKQSLHEALQIIRFWTNEMYDLFLIDNRLADIILAHPIVTVFETRIDDSVLKLYQPFLFAEVFLFGKRQ